MKKVVLFVSLFCILALGFFQINCTTSSDGEYLILWYFSHPYVFVTDGAANFSNPNDPVTGTDITGATVTLTNDTTGVSSSTAYTTGTVRNSYQNADGFSHSAGESVSISVVKGSKSYPSSSTVTPISYHSSLVPIESATVTLPFNITWTVTQGAYPCTHTWVQITDYNGATDATKNYQVVVPVSEKSLQITSSNIVAGTYSILVWGVNPMTMSGGAKAGSVGYVSGDGASAFTSLVTVQ